MRKEKAILKGELRRKIDDLAQLTLKILEIQPPIRDMESVVGKLEGRIEEEDTIGEFSDGYITKTKGSEKHKFEIHVPKNQNEQRKNFTIAHEIGHLVLDMRVFEPEEWENATGTYYRSGNSLNESIANEFAAAFLMPEEEYYQQLRENMQEDGRVCVQKIADYFNVSVNAVQKRGYELGLFSPTI